MTFKCHSSTIQRLRLFRYRNKAIQPCYSANVPFIAAACETEKYLMRTPLSTKHAEISGYRCYNCEKCPARLEALTADPEKGKGDVSMKDGNFCILIADDETEIRDILKLLLTGEGYNVIAAKNGQEALALASEDVDLYILDVNMPELSGFMAGTQLRTKYDAPIIFLTAFSAETDKIMGFSVGADDYIIKPFSNMELLMRVKAVLRRSAKAPARPPREESANQIVFEDLIMDLDRQCLLRQQDEIIPLTDTEFRILKLLVTHRKKIYSLENTYRSIWGENAVGDSAIMVHIKNIRKKLGDNSKNPKYIKTAWGRGYYVD